MDSLEKHSRNMDIYLRRMEGSATLQALGDEYGLTRERIRQIIIAAELKILCRGGEVIARIPEQNKKRGEGHYRAKLNEDKVREIRQRYQDGESQKKIAGDYGITYVCVHQVISRKSWRHVE